MVICGYKGVPQVHPETRSALSARETDRSPESDVASQTLRYLLIFTSTKAQKGKDQSKFLLNYH